MAERPLRWSESDLDRCEHGRHSIDSCFDCPGGKSAGNRFLLETTQESYVITFPDGATRVRIGTTYDAWPILVWAVQHPRPSGA